MIILLGIILVSRVNCRSFIANLPESPDYRSLNPEIMDNINEEFDAYLDLGNVKETLNQHPSSDDSTITAFQGANGDSDEYDILSEQIFSNKLNTGNQFGLNKDRELIQTYILVKTMRQRNKRYVNYLTLCHFKICTIGRRNARHDNVLKRERKAPLKFRSKKN